MAQKTTFTIEQIADYLIGGFWHSVGETVHHFATASITYNISGLTAVGQNLARIALQTWQDVAGISFVQTSGPASITFDDVQAAAAFTSDSYVDGATTSATINIGTSWVATYGTQTGSYSLQTYIHEIGHALGLGHAGPYNGSAFYSSIQGLGDNLYLNDTWQESVMSYFAQSQWTASGSSFRYVSTPMAADILAVQELYGAATNTRIGDTYYGFHSNAGALFDFDIYRQLGQRAPALTIVDSGGVNTLDASGYTTDDVISLIAGTASSVGGLKNNIAIDAHTLIQNAVAGAGKVLLIGNEAANVLTGGAGGDTFDPGSGNDTLIGGAGSDVFIERPGSGSDTIIGFHAGAAAGHDIVKLDGFNFGSFLALKSAMLQAGSDVALALGGTDQIILSNTTLSQLTADNFSITYAPPPITSSSGQSIGYFESPLAQAGVDWHLVGASDLSGRGKADLLWARATGEVASWQMDGGTFLGSTASAGRMGSEWHASGLGDFNGDGKGDIFWTRNTGQTAVWQMDGADPAAAALTNGQIGADWHIAGTGDFDGDHKADVLWVRDTNEVAVWTMNGTQVAGGGLAEGRVGTEWHTAGIGDFDGNGKADILWANGSGQVAVWSMDGAHMTDAALSGGRMGADWHAVGVGDLDGDGKADLVWQRDTGEVAFWLMNGTSVRNAAVFGTHTDPGFHLAEVRDLDGDGRQDLLWADSQNNTCVWTMKLAQADWAHV